MIFKFNDSELHQLPFQSNDQRKHAFGIYYFFEVNSIKMKNVFLSKESRSKNGQFVDLHVFLNPRKNSKS